jgi:HSP20 family protein
MTKLVRWSPFREMMSLRDEFDRLLEESFDALPSSRWRKTDGWGLAVDMSESEDEFVVKASVPGINPGDLEITLVDNVLTIRGERKEEKEVDEERYHLRERRFGVFSRSITLPVKVDEDGIKATCDNGILTVNIPKAEEIKPKRININVGDGRKTIEG